jgi:transposase
MVVAIAPTADFNGLPLAADTASASPHEVTLVYTTLAQSFTRHKPERLIGDRAYDSEPLDAELKAEGIEMVVPHKSNRVKPATQDRRALRRYCRRWKVERLNAWLQNCRRIATRFDYYAENYLGFVHLGCIKILLRCYL